MNTQRADQELDPATREFYAQVLITLNEAQVPFLVGGAYAFERYTGITRHTKDLDIFVRPGDAKRTLDVLAAAGYRTELTYSHWLGKAFHGENFIDVIFRSSNGVSEVSNTWFEHAVDDIQDARVQPVGTLTEAQAAHQTAALSEESSAS